MCPACNSRGRNRHQQAHQVLVSSAEGSDEVLDHLGAGFHLSAFKVAEDASLVPADCFGQFAARQYESWDLTGRARGWPVWSGLLPQELTGPTRQLGWPVCVWLPQQERHGIGARPPRGAKSIGLGQSGGHVDNHLIDDEEFFV